MEKTIKIKPFHLVDYNVLLKVVSTYIEKYHNHRNKLKYEKDFFDLSDEVYFITCFKHPVKIDIEEHFKPFWVKVKESRTQYNFEIWYAS